MNRNTEKTGYILKKTRTKKNQRTMPYPQCFNPLFPIFGCGGMIGIYPPTQNTICNKCVACGGHGCLVGSEYANGGPDEENSEMRLLIDLIIWMGEQSCRVSRVVEDFVDYEETKHPMLCSERCFEKDIVSKLFELHDCQVLELYRKCKEIRRTLKVVYDR